MKGSLFFRSLGGFIASIVVLISTAIHSPAQTAGGGGTPPVFRLTVKIVSPTNAMFFAAPATIPITADVQDYGFYPDHVWFYAGSNLLAQFIMDPIGPSETNGLVVPVQYNWAGVPPGAYSLTVVVSDTGGLTVTSLPVNVTVTTNIGAPPVVTIVATDPIASVCTNFPWFPPPTAAANYMTGTNTATFLVRRAGDTNNDLTVDYAIGGTASNGVDYATLPGYVTIPAGRRFALITIFPQKAVHSSARPYLTVILSLIEPPPPLSPVNTPPPYIVGWPGKAEAIILEDCNVALPVTGVLADSSFNVCLPAANGMNFCMELSSDLVNWLPICTNTVVKGAIQFVDPDAGAFGARYYRAVPVGGPAAY